MSDEINKVLKSEHREYPAYAIEVRSRLGRPIPFRGTLYGETWRWYDGNYYRKERALAMAWDMLADSCESETEYGLAVRLRRVEVKASTEVRETETIEELTVEDGV